MKTQTVKYAVTPARDEGKFSEQAILHSGPNDQAFGMVIVVGGSTDRTARIIDKFAREYRGFMRCTARIAAFGRMLPRRRRTTDVALCGATIGNLLSNSKPTSNDASSD